ncbi:hypothetical protein DUNSADRAFT_4780 [Dunaliella salina]|uniref:Stress-response A/B barrel domain-containing protein n=1 Tax=Dunaliella salina TaxID=3046 RepID=A0ABQ7GRC8_DUNSA|nr:hypothetical protein DUNSADRAFT_4780 [Dunaliella salina]|eukprot:KAF5837159.1 hypothetical protein DUNSADRAFT_4780 [Dunaliella salina]
MDRRKTLLAALATIAFLMLASVASRQVLTTSSNKPRFFGNPNSSSTQRQSSVSVMAGIRHCVLLKLKDNSPEVISRIKTNLDKLPALIPQIQGYQTGPDARISEGNADFAITADFASEADFKTYATHPEHVKALTEHVKPVLEQRTAVQFRT